ncbi:MAG: HNH endonuclease [Brachymonas sp.]|nr:HNH endonuclease [Brachymonas sp.]
MFTQVLQLDVHGTPQAWIAVEQAALHYATDRVAWQLGQGPLAVLRGGFNVPLQRDSVLEVHPIIAVRGAAKCNLFDVTPSVTKDKLLRRDRHTCAYCGDVFAAQDLQCEHILPESRGGAWCWMNLVAACAGCNGRKAARTPDEARMPLLYLHYVPSRFEDFLLKGRNIRADVHEWLAARLPKNSRLN